MKMQIDPLISIVIPVFNRENTILYCLNSVLAQTYNNIDVIVVDDCSTDSTVDIVNNYPDSRVRCIVLEKNSGAQAARNRGIKEAKGEWIAFQDSDDEWLPDKLKKQVSALMDIDYDPWVVVHTNAFIYDTVRKKKKIRLSPVVEGDDQYSTLLKSPGPLYQAMLVSTVALERINFLDENVPSFQEWDTSIRLAKYCRFIHIKEPLIIYHRGDSSAISSDKSRFVAGMHYIHNKYESDIKKICGEETWQNLNIQLLRYCLTFGLIDLFDRYRSRVSLSNAELVKMLYLLFCRKYYIKPNNIIFRFVRKIHQNLKN